MKPAAILFATTVALATYALNASSNSGLPDNWAVIGEAPQLYAGDVDSADTPTRTDSLVLRRTETSHPYASAALVKRLPAQDYAGKQVRLSMRVRAEGPEFPGVGVYVGHGKSVHVTGVNAANLKTWTYVQSLITLPRNLESLNAGINLHGPGLVKVNDLKLEVVGDAPADQKGVSIRMEEESTRP